jgi:hypothetical protein
VWPTYADKWPRLAPTRWTPDRTAGAMVVCQRDERHAPNVLTPYDNPADAIAADAEGCQLDGCQHRHYVVFALPGRLVVRPGRHDSE